mgnify:CR=1 FL=1
MASEVDIINSALNMVGASNIIARAEDSKSARITNQRYDYIRDAVLRAHPWNCAISRATIAADADSPTFGFTNQFTLPTDPYCLRVLRLEYLDIDFRVEGRKIHCDEDTIKVIFISRVTDPNEYDQLLIETIAARLAADSSYALAQSSTLTSTMWQLYENKLSEARFIDATEGTPGAIQSVTVSGSIQADTLVNARL